MHVAQFPCSHENGGRRPPAARGLEDACRRRRTAIVCLRRSSRITSSVSGIVPAIVGDPAAWLGG